MVSILKSLHPLTDALGGELAHTASMPWWVARVCRAGDYAEYAGTDVELLALEPYGPDTWASLEASAAFDAPSVSRARAELTYKPDALAFYPLAVLSHASVRELGLSSRYSVQERSQADAKLFDALVLGRLQVSADARQMLGDGFGPGLPARAGAPIRELMELALDDGSRLLGLGWVWYRSL